MREKAFNRLYRRHFAKLVRNLRSFFGAGPPDPEEIAQQTFERLLRTADLESIDDFEAFLWRAAKNTRISEVRAVIVRTRGADAVRRLFSDEEGYLSSPERVFEAKEDLDMAFEELRRMPAQRRSAFILVRMDGLSHGEAARRLGVSRPAVSKHVARATADLYCALRRGAQ